jgi:acetyl esterase/lipase
LPISYTCKGNLCENFRRLYENKEFCGWGQGVLFLTSRSDPLLSNTVNLHRAFVNTGVPAQLVVFDGLAHAFWNQWGWPESKEAHHMMADFFDRNLGR